MQFKHPELLYALFALLIPIVVHLFQLRKFQKEAFTNVAFLKEVTLQTRKSSVIKKWLTLITRLLLLAALIIAFAQPFTSKTNNPNTKTETVIYLDNSFSLQAKGAEGELLKRAVQDIISDVPEDEVISILTNDKTYKNTSIKAIKNDLLELDYSQNQLHFDAVMLKSKTLFSNKKNLKKNLILISDFQQQKNSFNPTTDSLTNIHTVALRPINTGNISVDSVYISKTTATNIDLTVRLRNAGSPLDNVPVSLLNNNQLIAKTAVAIQNEAFTNFSIPLNENINGEITIDDTHLQFDNILYFNLNKSEKINVLSINASDDSFLKRIFTETEFNYSSVNLNQLNYSDLDKQNLILLNELNSIPNGLVTALTDYIKNNGFVIVIPSETSDIPTYNSFLLQYGLAFKTQISSEKKITTINYSHPLYKYVFDKRVENFQYPKVNSYYSYELENASKILQFEDGKSFLTNRNNLYVFASALNNKNSNFRNSPLIVPTLYNIAKQSLQVPNIYYTIGQENKFDVNTTLQQDDILTLQKEDSNLIPQQQYFNNKVSITTNDIPNIAGIYTIKNKAETLKNVSFNYNRSESKLIYQDLSTLDNIIKSESITELFNTIKSDSKINELWKWFIIFALVFLIIEMLILKYFK